MVPLQDMLFGFERDNFVSANLCYIILVSESIGSIKSGSTMRQATGATYAVISDDLPKCIDDLLHRKPIDRAVRDSQCCGESSLR